MPAKLEQQKKEFDAELEDRKDEREYRQTTGNLAVDVLMKTQREMTEELGKEIDTFAKTLQDHTAAVIKLTETVSQSERRDARYINNFSETIRLLAGIIEEKLAANPTSNKKY